jgi:hypothetical protein
MSRNLLPKVFASSHKLSDNLELLSTTASLRRNAQSETRYMNSSVTPVSSSLVRVIHFQIVFDVNFVAGRVREQKRVRKLLRLVANSSPINIAVWEECFYRWSALSEFIGQNSLAAAAAFDDSHLSKHEQSMSLEVFSPPGYLRL